MTDRKQQAGATPANLRFRNTLLVVIAALCTFGGPYVVYVLSHLLKLSLLVSMVSGFAVFLVGLVFIGYLVKTKVIS